MKRRKFIQSTAIASTVPAAHLIQNPMNETPTKEKELYELRRYEMKFGRKQSLLENYLNEILQPALQKRGANFFQTFNELGNEEPRNIWVLISYPDSKTYIDCQSMISETAFLKNAKSYNELSPQESTYNRFSSSLFLAFDGLPQMKQPIDDASIFELRTYEGHSEEAVRRKISMFNIEEIELFYKVKLNPVFFGEMIAGPHRPCLTYMLNFKNMEERNKSWGDFLAHPDWNSMKVKPEYADSLSNIRKVFLTPF